MWMWSAFVSSWSLSEEDSEFESALFRAVSFMDGGGFGVEGVEENWHIFFVFLLAPEFSPHFLLSLSTMSPVEITTSLHTCSSKAPTSGPCTLSSP